MFDNKNRILVITRDLSYPGGTEYFLYDYLRYLSNHINPANIYLLEVEGSGKFVNKNLETDLVENGENILTIPNDIAKLEFWDPLKLSYIDDLVTQIGPWIVHTFLFNADFVAFCLKVRKGVCSDSISKTKSINKFRKFYPMAFLGLPTINTHRFKWISSKLNNFSVALEMDTDRWEVRKDFIDNELEPIISQYSDEVTVVSNEGLTKWAKWTTKPPTLVPCSAVGRNDLVVIDKLISRNHGRHVSDQITRFICTSRLVTGKGVEDIVTAFKKATLFNQDIKLTIIGDGGLLDSIKDSSSNTPQIEVAGFLPREKVFQALSESDVFISASYFEGLPLSIQEAMAFRLPVIATNVGGIPDLVTNRENGILFNPGDIDALSSSILELSQSLDIRQQMGILSRHKLGSNFLKEKSYDTLLGLYS